MANPYYTASPMVNFQYESKPSEAQGVLDTMKQIKKEGIEDEKRQMEMLQAQQAYEVGNMKMQGAQMEMDKVKRREQIEQQSSQIYNSHLASGAPRPKAMRAVMDYRQANLDWSERQKDVEEMKKSSLEALKFADRVGLEALEDAAAQFSVAFGVEVTPEQFQQMSKNRQPITTKEGRIYGWDNAQNAYVDETPPAHAKRLDEATAYEREGEAEDRALKRENLQSLKEQRAAINEDRAIRREEGQRARDLDMEIKEQKLEKMKAVKSPVGNLTPEQKRVAKFEEKQLDTINNKIDQLKIAGNTGKVDFIDAILAERGLSAGGLNAMNPQDRKAKIDGLIEDYQAILDELSEDMIARAIPGSEEIARMARKKAGIKSAPVTNPTVDPVGVASGTKTLDPGSKYGLALQNAKKRQSTGGK